MPDIIQFVARHFWFIALVINGLNAYVYRRRFQVYIQDHPERALGYHQFLAWFMVIDAILWGSIGPGILFGGLPGVFSYFNPSAGNSFVLAWHGVLYALWILGVYWIFFRGGSQFFVDHPGIFTANMGRARYVKFLFGICFLGGALGAAFMWMVGPNIPFP
jgi:hypothetical protein